MKLSQAIEEFKNWRGFKVSGRTVVRYDRVLRIFCLCMGDPEIEQVELRHVLGHLQELERLGWKRNGINIVAISLRKLFEFFSLRGFRCLDAALIPLPSKEYNIPRVATEEDYEKLLKAIPRDGKDTNVRNLALVSMIWDTWARSGEILSLDEGDIDHERRAAVIKTEKSRGRRPIREIFWTEETEKHLRAWIAHKAEMQQTMRFDDPNALFVSVRKCGPYDTRGKRMTNNGVCEMFRMISNRAGLPTVFNAHSARHRGGREIIKRGGSNADVSNILGHSHLDSSMIYTMMWGEELRERCNLFRAKKNLDLRHLTGEQAFNAFMDYIQKGGLTPPSAQFQGGVKKTDIQTPNGGIWRKT